MSDQRGYFDYWRPNRGPTQFFQVSIPTTWDPYLFAFTFVIIVITLGFLFILPGFRGITKLYYFIRVSISIFILWAILVGAVGQTWEAGEVKTRVPYKVFSRRIINASLGVKIGLQSVNITLLTHPMQQQIGQEVVERIDFNERYEWKWRQGREGYGPFSGEIQQQYRKAQNEGTPLPILWIAEYFTIDEELIRWGRSFRTAGWFTWIVIWSSLPLWAAANFLSLVVLFYAGMLFIGTGVLLLTGNIIYASIRWGTQPMEIPFQDGTIRLQLGVSFYLVLSAGLLSVVYGVIIVVADFWAPQASADFFGLDVTNDGEQFLHRSEESQEESGDESDVEARKSQRRHHSRTILYRLRPTRRRRKRPNNLSQQPLEEHCNENYEDEVSEIITQGGNKEPTTSTSLSEASSSGSLPSLPSYGENPSVSFSTVVEGVEEESSCDETKV